MAVSLKSVAERAGVSTSTVSKVLNGAPHFAVQDATRERIEKAVLELGYVPNAMAQKLGRGKGRSADEKAEAEELSPKSSAVPRHESSQVLRAPASVVGCVVSHTVPHHWDLEIIGGVEKQLSRSGAVMAASPWLFASGDKQPAAEVQVQRLLEDGCAAVVVLALSEDPEFAYSILSSLDVEAPVIFVTGMGIPGPVSHICYSSFDAGYEAARHLISTGWNRLGFAGVTNYKWSADRHAGAVAAAKSLPGAQGEMILSNFSQDESTDTSFTEMGRHLARTLLEGPDRVDGIIAANDLIAAGILETADELNLRAGRDFGLVGFDNNAVARQFGITTMQPPIEEMAREAALHCLDRVSAGAAPRALRLQSHLIVRTSSYRV